MITHRSVPRCFGTRWLLALGTVVLLLGAAWSSVSRHEYANGSLGFSMMPPTFGFGPDVKIANIAHFYAAPVDGFVSNVGVQLHRTKFADFCKATEAELKGGTITLVSSKELTLNKAAAHEYHYKMAVNGQDLEFLQVAVASGDTTLLLTGTTKPAEFAKVEPVFRAAFESFKLDK